MERITIKRDRDMMMTKDFEEYIKHVEKEINRIYRNNKHLVRKDKIKKINGNEIFKSNTTVL